MVIEKKMIVGQVMHHLTNQQPKYHQSLLTWDGKILLSKLLSKLLNFSKVAFALSASQYWG
jgi:hypothetical protein